MGICICCCCNKQKTECLETTLIVFQSIQIVFLILGLILIDWDIASASNLVINIFILLFLLFNLISVILFKVFREYDKIYNKYKQLCTIFSYIAMFLSIASIFLSIISESLISEKIYQHDHPCLYRLSNTTGLDNRLLAEYNETLIESYCDNNLTDIYSIFWYNKRSAYKDIIMSYLCSSIIEVFSLLSAFFYYNDMKRIKYCIKGRMSEENGLIKYGKLGAYLGKVGEKKGMKKLNKKNGTPQKEKNNNMLNVNKNNISEDNSIVWNSNKKKNITEINENEIEKEGINEFEELSNISAKNPSTKDNKQLDEMSNDLQVFY